MEKAKIKTTPNNLSVSEYLNSCKDQQRIEDCLVLLEIMKKETKEEPVMWGNSIIGFGKKEMTYASGRKVEWLVMGFSLRKKAISLYLTCDISQFKNELKELGKYKTGVGCLYIDKLENINIPVLKKIIKKSKKIN